MTDDAAKFYVRFRGRKTGPFTRAQVEQMKRRGQVTRFHEFSVDGKSWIAWAGTVPNDAVAGPLAECQSSILASNIFEDDEQSLVSQPQTQPVGPPQRAWFYVASDGEEVGPVPERDLMRLWSHNEINPRTSVWTEGMANWMPLKRTDLVSHLSGLNGNLAGKG